MLNRPGLKIPNLGINIPNMGIQTTPVTAQLPLSMADALFSKTQQRVLALLFGQPARSYYATEIMALAEGGRGAIQRELAKLSSSGLVKVMNIGSQRHYQANAEAPIFAELVALVQKTVGMVEPIRHALLPLTDQIGLAFVFGSVAKGTDSASSDIDLMIISDKLEYADVFKALDGLSADLGREIQPTIYTRKELTTRMVADNSFIKRVLEQPKLWVIGQESELPAR